jgi:hypothetical protein
MITGIVEIRNFLPNPDDIVKVAKSCDFYSLNEHPELLERTLNWEGMRSDSLYKFDKELSDQLFHNLFMSVAKHIAGSDQFRLGYEYHGNSLFHYMTKKDIYTDSWIHADSGSLFAGVLYLNKETDTTAGTAIYIDGKKVEVENEYNKLVLYPAHLKHNAISGFGNDVNDARLSIAFFISSVTFRLGLE